MILCQARFTIQQVNYTICRYKKYNHKHFFQKLYLKNLLLNLYLIVHKINNNVYRKSMYVYTSLDACEKPKPKFMFQIVMQ